MTEAQQPPTGDPEFVANVSAAPVPVGAPAGPPRRRRGLAAVVALTVLGLVGVLGGGAVLGTELKRKPTSAEQTAALAAEIASRWQRLPATTIFPAAITYFDASGAKTTAGLAAIARETSCQRALEPAAFQQLHGLRCTAMLRATYVDASGTLATTVGIAVLPSPAAAERVQASLDPMKAGSGLYALPAAGTLATAFGSAQRAADGAEIAGPYLLLFTAGYTDGVPGGDVTINDDLVALGSGVLAAMDKTLTSHTRPCAMKDIQC
jgi:hypothetical protein